MKHSADPAELWSYVYIKLTMWAYAYLSGLLASSKYSAGLDPIHIIVKKRYQNVVRQAPRDVNLFHIMPRRMQFRHISQSFLVT